MAVKISAPVTSTKVNKTQVEDMRGAVSELGAGEFASDGIEYDKRSAAGGMATTYIRLLGISQTHRARTWETAPEKWVFGIAPRPEKKENKKVSTAPNAPKK